MSDRDCEPVAMTVEMGGLPAAAMAKPPGPPAGDEEKSGGAGNSRKAGG